MKRLHGRIAIFILGVAGAQACGDSSTPPPPVCDDDDQCEEGEESCLDCASCGDGNKDPSEPCDDGNDADNDACVAPCQLARCGDGFKQEGVEACDDGDDDNSDAPGLEEHCNAGCSAVIPSTCGDTVCDPHENESTCAVDCAVPTSCGNMIVEVGELCDDGPGGSATCDVDCSDAVCGDGQTNAAAGEDCDDGNADDSDDCIRGCKAASCGDGILRLGADSDEECDDGNQDDRDSCSAECLIIEHRKVFVTSVSYLGDLGGLDGADAECNTLAMTVGLDGSYRAWLSDSVDGPATRFDTAFAGIYELNDEDSSIVAERGWDGLTKDLLQHPINVDENGQEYLTGVWTNTDLQGLPQTVDETCTDWTSVDSDASVGNSGSVDINWTFGNASQGCATGFSLYCFQDG